MEHFWEVALSVGGVGAIGAFVFWSLYKGWLKLGIFQTLSSAQTFRLMILFLVLTFIFASIALVGFLLRNKLPSLGSASPRLTVESLKNATYDLNEEPITLKDGSRDFKDPNQSGSTSVRLIEWAFGDLDGDGNQDAAVVLSGNWGGSGIFMYIVPVINDAGVPQTRNPSFEFGDRNTFRGVSISNRIVSVEYLEHGPYDAACCPTMLTTIHLELRGRQLECADQDCIKKTE
jgi:hypothetical protein